MPEVPVGFIFATTLISWHLLVKFCSLHVALWMKLFEHKPFDLRAVMGFGVLIGISIGLLIGFNSVCFYKELVLPDCFLRAKAIGPMNHAYYRSDERRDNMFPDKTYLAGLMDGDQRRKQRNVLEL